MKFRAAGVMLLIPLAILMLGSPLASEDEHKEKAGQLVSEVSHWWVGEVRNEGFLAWEADLEGDIEGTMRWWIGPAPDPEEDGENAVYYYVARWEIWETDGETLLLAGESAGKTVYVPATAADGVWDGRGVVTAGHKKLKKLVGHTIYESGPVPASCFAGAQPCARGPFVIH